MAERKDREGAGIVPQFDIVLWGYHPEQVQRCLEDMTARLEEALGQLDTVQVLQAELCDAHVEIDQLRLAAEEHPSTADRLSRIMWAAEQLRSQAEQAARGGVRSGATEPAASGY